MMSLRLRLSLTYSLVVALTLVVFGAILYAIQVSYTLSWLKRDLAVSSDVLSQNILRIYTDRPPPGDSNGKVSTGSAHLVVAQPEAAQAGATPPGWALPGAQAPAAAPPGSAPPGSPPPSSALAGAQPPPPLSPQVISQNTGFQQLSESEMVRVFDPDGVAIASPSGSSENTFPLSQSGLQAARQQQEYWETINAAGKRLLVYSRPVQYSGRVISLLQVGRSLEERDQSLRALAWALLAAVLLATMLAFGLGWLLAGVSLRPIQRITDTAQDIGGSRDFTRRLAYHGPADEVGRLALTFNSMLSQLDEAYQKVAQALEMQRSFVADVSHELRTPLTTLRGNLGLLGRTPPMPEEEQADILNDMVEESERLIRLVNDLLALARAEAGRPLKREALALRPLVEEACRQVHPLAPGRPFDLEGVQELSWLGDRDVLKQVLLILLDNALKHSPGAVTLSARQQGEQVLLTVQDAGPGLSSDQLEHVFDRFYRGDAAPGSGLGLPIARALVEGQGGRLSMVSHPGQGSTLQIVLPAAGAG
jgi:signal transduction histidine kinase